MTSCKCCGQEMPQKKKDNEYNIVCLNCGKNTTVDQQSYEPKTKTVSCYHCGAIMKVLPNGNVEEYDTPEISVKIYNREVIGIAMSMCHVVTCGRCGYPNASGYVCSHCGK